jgi:hypothetical protein
MKFLYRCLHGSLPMGVLIAGMALGLSANLITDVFANAQTSNRRLVSGLVLFIAAALFTTLHGHFSTIESNVRTLVARSDGIVSPEQLLTDHLKTRRRSILTLATLGFLTLLGGLLVASGAINALLKIL